MPPAGNEPFDIAAVGALQLQAAARRLRACSLRRSSIAAACSIDKLQLVLLTLLYRGANIRNML